MRSVELLAFAQSRARRKADLSSSWEVVNSAPRIVDAWAITGSAGSHAAAFMAAPSVVVLPGADLSVYVVTRAFVSRIKCKLVFSVMICLGSVLPKEPT